MSTISAKFQSTQSSIYWLLMHALVLSMIINTQVKAADVTTLHTPSLLHKASLQSREDAFQLLTNNTFHQQLLSLAKLIPETAVDEQGMFNKIALLSILGHHKQAIDLIKSHPNGINYTHYLLRSSVLASSNHASLNLTREINKAFADQLNTVDDEKLVNLSLALGWSIDNAQNYAHNIFKELQQNKSLSISQAVNLITNTHLYQVLTDVIPVVQPLLNAEQKKRFDIQPELLITTDDGIEIATTIVMPKDRPVKMPTAMQFTIYADEASHIKTAMHAAAHGYIGVVANSRGKRSSNNEITPFENDGKDAAAIINWISKQPWSNGDVVMYGGSYNGFTQWAATKYMPNALKAIAPYTAASIITGLPYENNIMLTANYEWAFYVTNNKTVDESVYANWQKRTALVNNLFKSGKEISAIDSLDGKSNPWFQKWIEHPSFDEYYQAMIPVKQEYKDINIPVLTVTGYFDGGQISAIDYLTRHYTYNPDADHTLLIGPYNHYTAQNKVRSHHSNYKLDEVALEKDTEEVVFQWFDYLLKNKPKPKLLQDKVNYQLMGSNQWVHKASLNKMNQDAQSFYFSTKASEHGHFTFTTAKERNLSYIKQTVDMADRTTEHNVSPWPIVSDTFEVDNGIVLMTEPFEQPMELSGQITGTFSIAVNKKDVDIGYSLFAIDSAGKSMHLQTYISRASYAADMSKRNLLTPNEKTTIPIVNARMTAKLFDRGSRLALVLNVNKNRNAQVNMGSGKDVGKETIEDAGKPLTLKWFNDSEIKLPLRVW
ncbi:CocE/NonD family hydrolase [Thalassotalea sp. 1_MG-2023]|uniref:CocE/NonD family hydrolase n=1 Tax=Thalassotalea sp. 1_MG-2023 TaxID=3062680 RepID=UPI0026E33F78|nr:CocE/NonD family hydrolase [Thalassotalea sp. 1_MG-2023]MDO6426079.1 CocE/NonD family hydrolase [Thalassotalea sp. 1_MG-2023]